MLQPKYKIDMATRLRSIYRAVGPE